MVSANRSLTHLAETMRDDSTMKENIRSVEIMGGAVKSPENVGTVPAEWNIYIDPVAAEEVFASGMAVRVTPLDATDQVPWMESDAAAWEASDAPAGSVAARFLRRTMSDWGSRRIPIWDLVAALNAAHPELCQWQEIHLVVPNQARPTKARPSWSMTRHPMSKRAWVLMSTPTMTKQ